ncbi:MAG: glycoside hydrolase family 15 protein [Pseudomonadota bacterium]
MAQDPRREGYERVARYLAQGAIHREVLTSEGQFVMAFNDDLVPLIANRLTGASLAEIRDRIAPGLEIRLTERGFAKGAERLVPDGGHDDTNYDAIWVRDSGWIYFGYRRIGATDEARRLLLALWDYYATAAQRERFDRVIADPALALDGTMHVPHVRFDGNSPDLDDVLVDGEPEVWNHRQNDAHGILLAAVAHATADGLIAAEDFTADRVTVLQQLPVYFERIAYHAYPGAGAWEEVNKVNVSSIAMVVRGLEQWRAVLCADDALAARIGTDPRQLDPLIASGYATIHAGLRQGGESTTLHGPYAVEFRRADAALFNLFLPLPLAELAEGELRLAAAILEKLSRPFGTIRYVNDSYQGANYWIRSGREVDPEGVPTATGDSSDRAAFLSRFRRLRPNTEAQWFFDSKLAMIRLALMRRTDDARTAEIDRFLAEWHLKRALGQVTGNSHAGVILGADGSPVGPLAVPESINQVLIDGRPGFLPSPITPLNWAKASLAMALADVADVI